MKALRTTKRKLSMWLLALLCLASTNVLYAQTDDTLRGDTLSEVVVTSQSAQQRISEIQVGLEKVNVETMSRLPSLFGERDIMGGVMLLLMLAANLGAKLYFRSSNDRRKLEELEKLAE